MSSSVALWLLLILLVLLRGLFGLLPSMWAWGLNVQRFLDPLTGWGLWGLTALSLFPPAARRLTAALEAAGSFLTRSHRAYGVAWLGGALLILAMRDNVWFVGDFLLRQGNVESGFFSGIYLGAMPLDVALHSALLRPWGHG